MGGIRLRTKFLLSMVVVSAALTFTTLLVVRHTVQQEVRLGIQRDLQNSVSAFHNFQKQREVTLERSAALLADLPNVRALMTTHDPATIQDASRDLWHLAGSDLLLLADSSGKVMALQATPQEITVREGQDFFPLVVSREETRHWWYVEGHLYEVFLQDIYFGPASGHQILGYLLLGYEIDDRVARDLSRVWRFDCAEHSEACPGRGVAANGPANCRWRPATRRSDPTGWGNVPGNGSGLAHARDTSA